MHRQLDWSKPAREDGEAVRLVSVSLLQTERVLCEINGVWNNADIYFSGAQAWLDANGNASIVPIFNLYVKIGGQHFLVESKTAASGSGQEAPKLLAGAFSAYLFKVRGRPGEGFRVSVTVPSDPLVPPIDFGIGNVYVVAWGRETAPAAEITIDGSTTIPVDIVAPNPLPVSGTVTVNESPATSWSEQHGTAPDTTTTAFAALAAGAAQRYVDVSADDANGGTLYVASAALASGASAGAAYQLGAGDSVRIFVNNASKIFVAGSVAGQLYRVAVT